MNTSRSMVEAGGVVNPDHSFHLMKLYNEKLSINRDFFSDMDDLIEPFIKESNTNTDLKDSVAVQEGED